MNRTIACLLGALYATAALAADQIGNPCQAKGQLSKTDDGLVIMCIDGKWADITAAGRFPIVYRVELKTLDKSGSTVKSSSGDISTFLGQSNHIAVVTHTPYSAGCEVVAGKTIALPGTITTGDTITMLPTKLEDGRIVTNVTWSLTKLTGLKDENSDRCTTQRPDIDRHEGQQTVNMKPGESISISLTPNVDSDKHDLRVTIDTRF